LCWAANERKVGVLIVLIVLNRVESSNSAMKSVVSLFAEAASGVALWQQRRPCLHALYCVLMTSASFEICLI
jgi:hypothetical protein